VEDQRLCPYKTTNSAVILCYFNLYGVTWKGPGCLESVVASRAVESLKIALTPTPRFLKLRLRLLHKDLICINNFKPIRHFITTTCIIRLLFRLITYI
jgi:hypothetical protein